MRLDFLVARGSDSALRPGVSGPSLAQSGRLRSGAIGDLNKSTSRGSSKRLKQLEFQSSPWDFFWRILRTCRMKPIALLANLLGNNPGSMKKSPSFASPTLMQDLQPVYHLERIGQRLEHRLI